MPHTIDGKFVSKEKYEAHMAAQAATTEETPMSGNVPTPDVATPAADKPKRGRKADPSTAFLVAHRKAQKELERVKALHAKVSELPSVEDAQAAADTAKAALADQLAL